MCTIVVHLDQYGLTFYACQLMPVAHTEYIMKTEAVVKKLRCQNLVSKYDFLLFWSVLPLCVLHTLVDTALKGDGTKILGIVSRDGS